MQATTTDVSALNSLLRGEMAALETYVQAHELGGENEPGAAEVQRIQLDHRDAADALWHHIEAHGGQPSKSAGTWGAFAKAVEGTAKLLGNKAALKALKEGEEHGLKEYEAALKDNDLPADCQALIRGLLAKQREHIVTLDRLLEAL